MELVTCSISLTTGMVESKKYSLFGEPAKFSRRPFLFPINGDHFSVVQVEGDGGAFWLAQILLLFHLNSRPKMKMMGECAFF